MQSYFVRDAKAEEQRELTRLCVRATMQAGYDEAFIDRVMPGLTITLPLITGGYVQLAQQNSGEVVGVVAVTPTTLQGIALLYSLFVDPACWKRGVGRALFGVAVTRAKALKAGALMIYAEPSAEGFYRRMGTVRIGEGPFVYSPEIMLPQLLYIIPDIRWYTDLTHTMSGPGTGQKDWATQQSRQQSRGTTDMLSGCPACLPLTPQLPSPKSAHCDAAMRGFEGLRAGILAVRFRAHGGSK